MVSDCGERCSFSINIAGRQEFSDIDGDRWHCPHPTHEDNDQCLFHLPPSKRTVDAETVTTRFRELIENDTSNYPVPDDQRQRFIGATFDELDLRHIILEGTDTRPIDIREATFNGPIDLSHSVLGHPVDASHATFEAPVRFVGAETNYPLRFDGATFDHQVLFDDATVGSLHCEHARFAHACRCRRTIASGDISFEDATIEGLSLEEATIQGSLYLQDSRCARRARIDGIDISRNLSLSRGQFKNGLWATQATIGDGLTSNDTHFGGPVHFHNATVEGRSRVHVATFQTIADFRGATFESISFSPARFGLEVRFDEAQFEDVSFDGVTTGETVSLRDVTVTGTAHLENVTFKHVIDCRDAEFEQLDITKPSHEAEYGTLDLRGATVNFGVFGQSANGVVYDLENATIGTVTLNESPGSSPLQLYRCLRTTFKDFDFSSHKLKFAESDWQLHDVGTHWDAQRQEPSPVDLEVTYLKAKNGASATGDSEAASRFYQKEMIHRRHKYISQLSKDPRPIRRLKAGMLATFNLFMGATTGFGERPRRVVVSSFAVIVGFALVYWQYLRPPLATGGDAMDYFALSTQIFLTFVLGTDVETTSLALTATAAVQGFIGAFFIALFVFTLTRSIKR
jgi:uncharacterized protein YjbI with pentapeptide repeats